MGRQSGTIDLPYVKGHMGGNTIALFPEGVLTEEKVVEKIFLALGETHLNCHEAGLVSPASGSFDLGLRIIGRTSKGFITACGGLTQVLGAAIGSGCLSAKFGFGPSGTANVLLDTEGGPVPLHITREANCGTVRTETDMTSFLEELRHGGIENIVLGGVHAVRAGKFLVLRADELAKKFAPEEIRELHSNVVQALIDLQQCFLAEYPRTGYDFALFDLHPSRREHLGRLVFPHCLSTGHVEPSCGTGTVAVCATLAFLGEIEGDFIRTVRFECGGDAHLGGPETTAVSLRMTEGEITSVRFSHSLVEVTSEGTVMLPVR